MNKICFKWRITTEIASENERVHKIANNILELPLSSSVGQRTQQDIFLTAIAGEQHLKGGHQNHIESDVLALAQFLQLFRQSFSQRQCFKRTGIALDCRTRFVAREVEYWQFPRELLLPVVPQCVPLRPAQELLLP